MSVLPFRIIPCSEWGAKPPKATAQRAAKPEGSIFHHTAGHHPEIENPNDESLEELFRYARDIQAFHMGPQRGWNDTGQNFTVGRNGYILEGRHGSLKALEQGYTIVSAHCPGKNHWPGVEIEHKDNEDMTPIQRTAALWLFAKIHKAYKLDVSTLKGHRDYFATDCPGHLYGQLPNFRKDVQIKLKPPEGNLPGPSPKPKWFWIWADWQRSGSPPPRPSEPPTKIPQWAWDALVKFNKEHPPK